MTAEIERHQSNARMSKFVRYGGVVYLAGQTSGGTDIADFQGQTLEVLKRIDALLAEAGSSRARLLSATIYLKSIADFAAMNVIWEKWLEGGPVPARTTVQSALAMDNLLLEITVVAAA
ncbi:MAG: RidA family protein [Burkholderiaceae bacterium]|nr:RidA family protein [Burkholderiaceae bacterium]